MKKCDGFLTCESPEDQDRLAALFRPLDAQILSVPGGHVGFIVQADTYLEKMDAFLKGHIVKD